MGQPSHEKFSYFLDVPTGSDHILAIIALSVMIAIGAFVLPFGLRLFRTTTLLIGFAVGFLITTTVISEYSSDVKAIYIPGLIAGVVVGLISSAVMQLGIIMHACVLGFVYAYLAYIGFLHYISTWNFVVLYVAIGLFSLLALIVALIAEKELIVVATSFAASMLILRSVDLFFDNKLTLRNLHRKEDLSGEGWGFWAAVLVLGGIGVLWQVLNPVSGTFTHHYCSRHHRQHCPNCHTYHHVRQSCPYLPRPEQMTLP